MSLGPASPVIVSSETGENVKRKIIRLREPDP